MGRPNALDSLRGRVRKELRASPHLAAERKRSRQGRSRRLPPRPARAFLGLLLGAVLVSNLPSFEAFLGALLLWATFSIFLRAWTLRQAWHESDDLLVWAHLPVADGDLFMQQWQRGWLRTLWSLYDMVVALTLGALHFGFIAHLVPMLFFGAAHWLIVLAGAILLVRYAPRLATPLAKAPLAGLAAMILCAPLMGLHPGEFLAQVHASAGWFLPAGWFNLVLHGALAGGAQEALTFTVLPVLAMIVAAALSWQCLRRSYRLADMPSEIELAETSHREHSRIWRNGFLQPERWSGLVERVAATWLTSREKDIAGFLAEERPGWTLHLQVALGAAVAGLAGAWFAAEWAHWWIWAAGVVAALFGLPILGGHWRGFEQQFVSGRYVPLYAVLPLGYGEMAAMMLKVNTVRSAVFLLPALAFGYLAGDSLGASPATGVGIALKLWLLVLIWQPTLVALRFAAGTNDTQCSPRTSLLLAGLFLGLSALSLALAMAQGALLVAIFTAAAATSSAGLMKYYQQRFEKDRFDLLSPIKRV